MHRQKRGVGFLQHRPHRRNVHEAILEHHFRHQESIGIVLHRHVLHVRGLGIGRQLDDHIHRIVAHRQIVAEIDIGAQMQAGIFAQDFHFLVDGAVLVVFHRQRDAHLFGDGQAGVQFPGGGDRPVLIVLQRLEGLVAAAHEADHPHGIGPQFLVAAQRLLERAQIRQMAGQKIEIALHEHAILVQLLPERLEVGAQRYGKLHAAAAHAMDIIHHLEGIDFAAIVGSHLAQIVAQRSLRGAQWRAWSVCRESRHRGSGRQRGASHHHVTPRCHCVSLPIFRRRSSRRR